MEFDMKVNVETVEEVVNTLTGVLPDNTLVALYLILEDGYRELFLDALAEVVADIAPDMFR